MLDVNWCGCYACLFGKHLVEIFMGATSLAYNRHYFIANALVLGSSHFLLCHVL